MDSRGPGFLLTEITLSHDKDHRNEGLRGLSSK